MIGGRTEMRNKKLKKGKSSHIPEIILIFFVILTIAPIYIMIVTSLKDQNEIVTNFGALLQHRIGRTFLKHGA